MLAVRWYLRYGLSYRDVEELHAERGIEVDHVTNATVPAELLNMCEGVIGRCQVRYRSRNLTSLVANAWHSRRYRLQPVNPAVRWIVLASVVDLTSVLAVSMAVMRHSFRR